MADGRRALKGDIRAAAELADRAEGRPGQNNPIAEAEKGFKVVVNSSGTAAAAMPSSYSYRFYCASDDFYRHFCSIDTLAHVQIVRQRSESPCIYGRTRGVTGGGIWVDRGCRAYFLVSRLESYDNDDYGNYRRSRILYCASDDFDFRGCPADTYTGVRAPAPTQ
jgi:hypothetical protein